MAEAPFSDEDSTPSPNFFSLSPREQTHIKSILDDDNLVPLQDIYKTDKDKRNSIYSKQVEHQISKSLDKLSTNQSDPKQTEQFRKRIRVGNHYQARIPKYLDDMVEYIDNDQLLWDPYVMDASSVDNFLNRASSLTKLLLPMGNHSKDDEQALYTLQLNNHDPEKSFKTLTTNPSFSSDNMSVWSEEECRNFEKGVLTFGKNFFLIQKYKVNSRHIRELVQFYYLWKKTERYDLFANRMRNGKKKYMLNPGISDLMCRYVGTQRMGLHALGPDVQFLITENGKDVPSNNSQY